MPRFVVLEHTGAPHPKPDPHWDFMFERDGGLVTWEFAELPAAGHYVSCRLLPVHRMAYLTYEGEVSGGRGRVKRVDSGEFRPVEDSPERWSAILAGQQVHGRLTIERVGALKPEVVGEDDSEGGDQQPSYRAILDVASSTSVGAGSG